MKRDYNAMQAGEPNNRQNNYNNHHHPPAHLHHHNHHPHHHHQHQNIPANYSTHHHMNPSSSSASSTLMSNNATTNNNIKPGKQLMSFQNYVRTLSNNVDENTAYKKYKDFMANLSQSKVGRFFDANKDREWFRLKYHPVESQKRVHQNNFNFLKRLKFFNDLNERNYFNLLPYSISHSTAILNLLDAIIVHLDDGPQELIDQLLSNGDKEVDQQLRETYVPSRPTSVVIDDISIDTTLAELQELCIEADPNLIRIAQLNPYYVEGGELRQKMVAIYKGSVDIRNVCWKLSRMKLNNRPLSVYINKCINNRIYAVDATTNHQTCIVNDIRNAIILILNLDELRGLYGKRKQLLENSLQEANSNNNNNAKETVKIKNEPQENNVDTIDNIAPLSPPGSEKSVREDDEEKPFDVSSLDEEREKEKKKLFEFKFNTELSVYRQVSKLNKSKNPILEEAYIYLVEYIESAAAQYHLSKVPKELQSEPTDVDLDKNDNDKFSTIELVVKNLPSSLEESTKLLDKMLWYLRIVHSFDYYKKAIYKLEDELTLRMSVIHLRDDPTKLSPEISASAIKEFLQKNDRELEEFGLSQAQKYVTKDEERFNYKSYGKVITDELASYAQRIQKAKSNETEEVYKCKHCTRVFQKLTDIGRHFVSKHRWAIDAIEMETDFFNAYLFDCTKINPCPPKELLDVPPNRFARLTTFSQMGEDPDLLQQTIEAYSKMESFVREPAPRAQTESDPRNDSIVDYTDISFDDAI